MYASIFSRPLFTPGPRVRPLAAASPPGCDARCAGSSPPASRAEEFGRFTVRILLFSLILLVHECDVGKTELRHSSLL